MSFGGWVVEEPCNGIGEAEGQMDNRQSYLNGAKAPPEGRWLMVRPSFEAPQVNGEGIPSR